MKPTEGPPGPSGISPSPPRRRRPDRLLMTQFETPARPVPPTQQLDDIPWSRVREALKVLLDLDDLTKLFDVVITPDAITATAVALDSSKPATHRITRRIVFMT